MIRDGLAVVVVCAGLGVVGPVPNKLIIPITPEAGIGSGVPFTDVRLGVAVVRECFRPERALLRIVGAARIIARHPHGLHRELMMAGEQRRARGHAPCAVIGGGETNTLPGQPVDTRRFHPRVCFLTATDGPVGRSGVAAASEPSPSIPSASGRTPSPAPDPPVRIFNPYRPASPFPAPRFRVTARTPALTGKRS